jgi:Mg2+-importing ATPase
VASCVLAAVGEWVNATIIFVMVLLGTAIVFIQTHHSQQAIERLRRTVSPTATVLRDGQWTELPRREIVPGDLIRLVAGDRVPAGAKLVDSEHLQLQESALTGESLPVEKKAPAGETGTSVDAVMVYLGTSVVTGT